MTQSLCGEHRSSANSGKFNLTNIGGQSPGPEHPGGYGEVVPQGASLLEFTIFTRRGENYRQLNIKSQRSKSDSWEMVVWWGDDCSLGKSHLLEDSEAMGHRTDRSEFKVERDGAAVTAGSRKHSPWMGGRIETSVPGQRSLYMPPDPLYTRVPLCFPLLTIFL